MKCSFCGRQYSEGSAAKACRSCALLGGCRKLKCPYCGYETPRQPQWIDWLRKKVHRHD